MDLSEAVAELEREANELEQRNLFREREVRAPAVVEENELSALEVRLAQERARLGQFTAELRADRSHMVVTVERIAWAASAMGAFCWGAVASGVDLPKVSVALFAGVWVAFLAGALRGR